MMTVTHNGKQYTIRKTTENVWRLTSVNRPRESFTLNRRQMELAGLLQQVEGKS